MSLCAQDLLNGARQRLAEIAKDPARYSTLLEGLLLQVNSPPAHVGGVQVNQLCI